MSPDLIPQYNTTHIEEYNTTQYNTTHKKSQIVALGKKSQFGKMWGVQNYKFTVSCIENPHQNDQQENKERQWELFVRS